MIWFRELWIPVSGTLLQELGFGNSKTWFRELPLPVSGTFAGTRTYALMTSVSLFQELVTYTRERRGLDHGGGRGKGTLVSGFWFRELVPNRVPAIPRLTTEGLMCDLGRGGAWRRAGVREAGWWGRGVGFLKQGTSSRNRVPETGFPKPGS